MPANLLAAEVALEPLHRTVITATSVAQALACLDARELITALLEGKGYEVLAAADGNVGSR